MTNQNQLGYYALCPILTKYKDVFLKDSLNWYSYDFDELEVRNDISRYIAVITYKLLLELLDKLKANTNYLPIIERKYNSLLWEVFLDSESNIRLAANGWVRLNLLIQKILKLVGKYEFVVANVSYNKRVFRTNPISIKGIIPLILTKKDYIDILLINPSDNYLNIDSYMALDFLEEQGFKINTVITLGYDYKIVNKQIHESWDIPVASFYRVKNSFFESLSNESLANKFFCNHCPYNKKCGTQQLSEKIILND